MFYCGIDIAKHNHEASIIDSEGKALLDSISFANTKEGCEKLLALLGRLNIGREAVAIGMEANGVTDEIFFLAMPKDGRISGWFIAGLAAGPYGGWVLGTLLGALAGGVLPASLSSALGIALYAMFIAIVVPPCRRSKAVAVTALTAVGLACLFRYMPGLRLIPSGWALILAAVAAGRAAFCDPILSEYYQSLKGRGKHYLTAVGALARKLCNIIFTILRENSPYEATPPKKGGEAYGNVDS